MSGKAIVLRPATRGEAVRHCVERKDRAGAEREVSDGRPGQVYPVDPLKDPRWQRFVLQHPRSSVFHTTGWLEALRRTYAYQPIALTMSPPSAELEHGIVFCHVDSRLTGGRLVSVPFSDHCEPLVERPNCLRKLLESLLASSRSQHFKYIELRPLGEPVEPGLGFQTSRAQWFHAISLRPTLDELFLSFHKDCVQRKIIRAHRENLSYEQGRSEQLLKDFYQLLVLTRRRQCIPPQPLTWFRNLIQCLGDRLTIRVARKSGRPVASILTLRHRDTVVYKYGCSDVNHNHLGGTQLLFWRCIEESKTDGVNELDLGRTDFDNPGLCTFKDRWNSRRSVLTYARWRGGGVETPDLAWVARMSSRFIAQLPGTLPNIAGRLLYRHFG